MSGVVHFKFRSALSYDSVSFDGHYISIAELKRLIADKKGLGADASAELELSDPQTKQPYADEAHQLPRNSSVVVRRVPVAKAPGRGPPPTGRGGVASTSAPEPAAPSYAPASTAPSSTTAAAGTKAEFGENPLDDEAAKLKASYADETSKIDAVVSAQDEAWRQDTERSILAGRGGGRGGPGGRGGRGAGRLRPPETYWCKICGAQGQHWVQECPRRHEANLDLKIVRAPAGIPMTLLSRSTEGGLLLPNGEIGVLKHSDDAFEREMAGLPSAEPRKPEAALPALVDKPAGDRAPSPAVPALPAPAAATPEHSPAPAAAASRLPVKLEQQAPAPAQQPEAPVVAAAVESRALVLVEPSPGLFDDDDLVEGEESPVQLGLGMGMMEAEEQPDTARAGARKGEAGARRSPQQESDELVPADINTLLPLLKGILPRGPLGALLRAFKPGRPLSSEQFAELRADYGRPPPVARVASGQSAGTRRTARSPPRDLARHPSPPGRHQLHRASRDGGFERDMGFERMPAGRMPGFERFGAFERQPPIERRWKSRSPTPERSRSRSISRRERARSPMGAADGFSRPAFRDERGLDRGMADRHMERRISSDALSWRDEPSWREQASWREEPDVRYEHRRALRAGVPELRLRERDGLRSMEDGRHQHGIEQRDGVHDAPHEHRKAHREDGEERSHRHSRSSKRTHGSAADADAVVVNGDISHSAEHAKRRRSSNGQHKEGGDVEHAGDHVDDARWLDTHPSMREASADLANLLEDDELGYNEEETTNEPEAHGPSREVPASPPRAASPFNPYRSHRASRSHSTSPVRATDVEERAVLNGSHHDSVAADEAEPAQVVAVKQEAVGSGDQSPKRREGSSRHHHKEKKSSKDKHKSSHKSKKERHKDKDKDKEHDPADGRGKDSHGPSRHASPARSSSPPRADADIGDKHPGRHADAAAGDVADDAPQPSSTSQRTGAADRPARVRSDGPQGLFGKALLGAVGRTGAEAGRQLSPSKRRPPVKVEEGMRDGGADGRTHKRSRRDY